MNKKESFESAIADAKAAVGFTDATQKMKAVNFAKEFALRGMDRWTDLEKQQ